MLVTFMGTLPPSEIRKRDCPFPPAGCLWEAVILLCFSGTWSVCEESRDWVWFLVVSIHGSCSWAGEAREYLQKPQGLCRAWAGQGRGDEDGESHVETAVHRLTTGLRPGGGGRMCPVFNQGCLPWPRIECVCVEPRSGSVMTPEGVRWIQHAVPGKGNRPLLKVPFAHLFSPLNNHMK